jgi:hypothetical protein
MSAEPGQHCVWHQDRDLRWDTDCGEVFGFVEGNPDSNGFEFCCFCGQALLAVPVTEEPE